MTTIKKNMSCAHRLMMIGVLALSLTSCANSRNVVDKGEGQGEVIPADVRMYSHELEYVQYTKNVLSFYALIEDQADRCLSGIQESVTCRNALDIYTTMINYRKDEDVSTTIFLTPYLDTSYPDTHQKVVRVQQLGHNFGV